MNNEMKKMAVDDELVEHCLEGNVEGLEQYLSAGNFGKINHGDEKTGDSPLHLAALSPLNSFELSRLLLDFGANPCSLNNRLESPVHCAAKAGHVDTLRLLIDGGGLSGILSTRREIAGAKKSRPSLKGASINIHDVCRVQNKCKQGEKVVLQGINRARNETI